MAFQYGAFEPDESSAPYEYGRRTSSTFETLEISSPHSKYNVGTPNASRGPGQGAGNRMGMGMGMGMGSTANRELVFRDHWYLDDDEVSGANPRS